MARVPRRADIHRRWRWNSGTPCGGGARGGRAGEGVDRGVARALCKAGSLRECLRRQLSTCTNTAGPFDECAGRPRRAPCPLSPATRLPHNPLESPPPHLHPRRHLHARQGRDKAQGLVVQPRQRLPPPPAVHVKVLQLHSCTQGAPVAAQQRAQGGEPLGHGACGPAPRGGGVGVSLVGGTPVLASLGAFGIAGRAQTSALLPVAPAAQPSWRELSKAGPGRARAPPSRPPTKTPPPHQPLTREAPLPAALGHEYVVYGRRHLVAAVGAAKLLDGLVSGPRQLQGEVHAAPLVLGAARGEEGGAGRGLGAPCLEPTALLRRRARMLRRASVRARLFLQACGWVGWAGACVCALRGPRAHPPPVRLQGDAR